jgi:hypothetical protein
MIISSIAYITGFALLLMRRPLPENLSVARVAIFAALVLCAAKNLLPPLWSLTIAHVTLISFSPQLPLAFLVAGTAAYAVWQLIQIVNEAAQLHYASRMLLQNWLALVIPPVASIGLLGLFDAVPEGDHSIVLYAFVLVNAIPAIYAIVNARYFIRQLRLR